jgi:hypothetical protein
MKAAPGEVMVILPLVELRLVIDRVGALPAYLSGDPGSSATM